MSFDIYGENLRPGFCEVHPHVAESYPCSLCHADLSRRAEQEREYQKAMDAEYDAYCKRMIGDLEIASWLTPQT